MKNSGSAHDVKCYILQHICNKRFALVGITVCTGLVQFSFQLLWLSASIIKLMNQMYGKQ